MLTHKHIWSAIDALAARHGLSASGLARKAGLDATAFNVSKRVSREGKARWPTTESIAKILAATQTSFPEFTGLVENNGDIARTYARIPVIGLAQAGESGFFDDGGFPVGSGWDDVVFPDLGDPNAYALEISGESMEPVFREGDIIIVSPAAGVRRGDRVVVKTTDGEVMAKLLKRKTARHVDLHSFNSAFTPRVINIDKIAWIARIVWASQ